MNAIIALTMLSLIMEVNEKRIEKSFETLNKLGRIMSARISEQYKKLKYDELYIAFEYQQKAG